MVLDFATDGSPCWFYSLIVDDFGFEWSAFEDQFNSDPAWDFLTSEQEH